MTDPSDPSETRPDARASAPLAAILAGGAARRFGGRKHDRRLPDGRTLLDVAAAAGDAVAREVVVVGHPPGLADDADRIVAAGRPRSVVPDRRRGEGPAAGVESALAAAATRRDARVIVLACDMPDVDAGVLEPLVAAVDSGAPAAAWADHPLPVALAAGLGARVTAFLDGGGRRLGDLLRHLEARRPEPPSSIAARLRNVNRPEDLRAEPD